MDENGTIIIYVLLLNGPRRHLGELQLYSLKDILIHFCWVKMHFRHRFYDAIKGIPAQNRAVISTTTPIAGVIFLRRCQTPTFLAIFEKVKG